MEKRKRRRGRDRERYRSKKGFDVRLQTSSTVHFLLMYGSLGKKVVRDNERNFWKVTINGLE